jgi:hypothetical protein
MFSMSGSTKKSPQLKMCDNCVKSYSSWNAFFCWLTAFGYSNYQNYLIFNIIYNINLEYKSSITIITDFVQWNISKPRNIVLLSTRGILFQWINTKIQLMAVVECSHYPNLIECSMFSPWYSRIKQQSVSCLILQIVGII